MNPSGDSNHEPIRTRLSRVDGQAGELIIGGFRLEDLVPQASFEEVVFLLWNDRLPTSDELRSLQEGMAREARPGARGGRTLERASQSGAGSMDALRLAVESQALEPPASAADDLAAWRGQALRIVARMPMLAAAYARLRAGAEPVDPPAGLGDAAAYLYRCAARLRMRRRHEPWKRTSTPSSITG